jgi:hypothetical protein
VRKENSLRQAEREIGAHFFDTLECRCARFGNVAGVTHRRKVAEAEAGIIMTRPNDSVEVDFDQSH